MLVLLVDLSEPYVDSIVVTILFGYSRYFVGSVIVNVWMKNEKNKK